MGALISAASMRFRLLALSAVLSLLTLVGVLSAPRADAIPFGANLNRAPTNNARCGDFVFFPPTFSTCSAVSTNLSTGENFFPPVGVGVVTQVRVRVGAVTAPMQVVVEQALRADNPSDPGHPTYACCKAINASQVFVPAPGAITAVNVNLPVRQDIAPDPNTGFYTDDHLALSVLDPNVPVPINVDNQSVLGMWFPAWQVGQERADSYGVGPYGMVLLNAEWVPAAGADRSPIEFLRRTLPVRAGNVFAPLQCVAGSPCIGPFLLQNLNARLLRLAAGPTPRLAKKGKKTLRTFAKKKIKIKAGKKKTVKIPLNSKGRRLLKGRKKVKVWANIDLKGVAKAADPSARVKLKVKKR